MGLHVARYCSKREDDDENKKEKKKSRITAANLERQLNDYNIATGQGQYHAGAAYVSSLHAKKSLRELAKQHDTDAAKGKSDENTDERKAGVTAKRKLDKYIKMHKLLHGSDDSDCEENRDIERENQDDDEFFFDNGPLCDFGGNDDDDMLDDDPPTLLRRDLDDESSVDTVWKEDPNNADVDDSDSSAEESDWSDLEPDDELPESRYFKLPSKFEATSLRYEWMKHKCPDEEKMKSFPKRFKYNNDLTNTLVSLVDLSYILSTRHKIDKKLFDVIYNWAKYWTDKDPNIWKSNGKANVWSRKSLMNKLSKVFQAEDLRPSQKETETHDGRKVTVPVFDFPTIITSILDDIDIFNENTILAGLDKSTWRPKVSAEEWGNDPHAVIGDKDTGYLYWQGIKAHCPDEEDCDPTEVLPLPLILHIDKSHYDLHGNLCVTPVGVSLAMLNSDTQQKVGAWRMLATVPNLSAKKGKNKKKTADDGRLSMEDMHNVLGLAFSSLRETYEAGGMLWRAPDGKLKILKPYIHMVIGDKVGNDELCAHFFGSNCNCLVKDCKCTFHQLPNVCQPVTFQDFEECEGDDYEIFRMYREKGLVTLEDLSDIINDVTKRKEISYHHLDYNAFDDLPIADVHRGIVGITPPELLHVLEAGVYEYITWVLHDTLGPKQSNAEKKQMVDQLFAEVKSFLERNSERDVLRMSNRSGFFNLSKTSATERHGNFFAMVILMHTTYGASLLRKAFADINVKFEDMRETCMLLLSWDRFLMDSNERWKYDDAMHATAVLMGRIKRDLPREFRQKSDEKGDGSHGWHISKFHVLFLVLWHCLKFGSAKVTHGSAAEKNHKFFVKRMASMTQLRLDVFAQQVSNNYFEYELINRAYRAVRNHCLNYNDINQYTAEENCPDRKDYLNESDLSGFSDNDEGIDGGFDRHAESAKNARGSFSMEVDLSKPGSYTSKYTWKSNDKNKLADLFEPSKQLVYALGRMAHAWADMIGAKSSDTLNVECFTELTLPIRINDDSDTKNILFRCSPNMFGKEWYDFALIRLPKAMEKNSKTGLWEERENGDTAAAKILGFVRYPKEALTYKKVQALRLDKGIISSTADETLYAVVHCEGGHLKYEYLAKNFIRKISLMDKTQIFIVPVGCILGPLLVVPDVTQTRAGDPKVSQKNFIVAPAHHKLGSYFDRWSMKLRLERENQGKKRKKSDDQTKGNLKDDLDKNYW